jgi:apolipoprotein N-acyltransferase
VRVYSTDAGRLATIICYDLDYLDTAREAARRRAQVVAVPSHDWGAIAGTHYTHLVFRAVENRLSMVKADAAWDSVAVDPYGRILTRAVHPDGGRALLVTDVPLGRGTTPAQTIAPWVPRVALVLALALWLTPIVRWRLRSEAGPESTRPS